MLEMFCKLVGLYIYIYIYDKRRRKRGKEIYFYFNILTNFIFPLPFFSLSLPPPPSSFPPPFPPPFPFSLPSPSLLHKSLLAFCYWTILLFSIFEASTLPFSSRNGVVLCLIYSSMPALLYYFGLQGDGLIDVFCDGLFMSMLTTDMIVGRKAGRFFFFFHF